MQRHFAGAYVLGVIELLMGGPLAYVGWRYFPELFRHPSPSDHLDDCLAFAAMAITGTATVVAAAVTILHSRLSYGVVRRVRIGAVFSDVWMLLTGLGMWVIARRRGGDWAGYGILAAFLLIAVGTIFLVLTLITLHYIRRMRPNSNASI